MTNKALISELTWRSLDMQKAAFPNMPFYYGPHEILHMLRPTSRNEVDHIYVSSLGVIAETEKDFRYFLSSMSNAKAWLITKEEDFSIAVKCANFDKLVKLWKEARRNGIQVIGGKISAELRRKQSAEGAAKIKDRWGMPSKTWPTKVLLKEADFTYNTAITILGPRPIAQFNYQAKLKR